MLDIRFIRENPDKVKENIKRKFQDDKLPMVDKLLKADEEYRAILKQSEKLRHDRNNITSEINELKKQGKDVSAQLKQAKEIPAKIRELEVKRDELREEVRGYLFAIPNILHKSVPNGKDATENVEIEKIGKPKKFDFEIKGHVEIAESLGMADFETSAEISGNGFYILKGDLALLNMALINYARDYMVKQGYLYVEPPLMIRKRVLNGVYSKEEIDQMSYKIEGEDLYLIATSEHPMIGMYMGKLLEKKELPVKITGYTACFRREIGSHGIDEKGLYRTHQFHKQEMIVICEPEDSYKFYDEMLKHSINLFKELGIPIRVFESCSADLGDLKAKGCDLEAWSPRREAYFEITSITNMESSQARRLGIKVQGKEGKYYAHTLNNTAIATSRVMVAILENFQNKDGSVDIPKALQPYIGGLKKLERK